MSQLSSTLVLSLVDQVTAPSRAIAKTVGRLNDSLERNNRQLKAMRGRMLETGAVAYGLVKAISAPVKAAMEFESAMADIRKVVDFDTPQAFKDLGKDIIQMSTQMPMAANGIAEIVAAAGQAGMKGDELLQFAELAAKVGIAFDMGAGVTGESLAKIKTQLGYTVAETGLLADALNHLSNTSASEASDLVDYMKRVASVGKIAGFSAQETAAIGSAMIATGAEANVAATSFRNMVKALSKGASATKRQKGAYKLLGLNSTKVAKGMQKDAVGTMKVVLAAVRKLPKHIQQAAISDLFGDEAKALMPLIDNADVLEKALGAVAEQANYLGSSQKEYAERAKTTANSMQLFQNKMTALGISIGSALLPALNDVMDALGPIILRLAEFAEQNPKLTSSIVAVTAGLVGLRVAALAAQFSFLWMKGGLLSAAITGLRGIGFAASVAGFGLKSIGMVGLLPFRALIAGAGKARIALIGFAAASSIGGIGSALTAALGGGARAFLQLLNPIKLVTAAMRVLKLAVIGTGIGAVIVGIAAAGTLIYSNWEGISTMFSAFGSAFMAAIEPIRPALQPVILIVQKLKDVWDAFTGKLNISNESWAEFGASAGRAIGNIVKWFAELPGKIIKAIGSIDLSKFIKFPSLPKWLGGGGGGSSNRGGRGRGGAAPVSTVIDGARAAGGAISAGKTYLTGERGPELITPRFGGMVHNAAKTASMLGSNIGLPRPRAMPSASSAGFGSGGSQGQAVSTRDVNLTFGDINIIGGAQASAQDLRREFGDEAGAQLRAQFSDGTV